MDSDFLLICRMKNGDDAAIEAFVRKYYPVLLRYCHFHIKNQADAEDAVQEVFVRFFSIPTGSRGNCRRRNCRNLR